MLAKILFPVRDNKFSLRIDALFAVHLVCRCSVEIYNGENTLKTIRVASKLQFCTLQFAMSRIVAGVNARMLDTLQR